MVQIEFSAWRVIFATVAIDGNVVLPCPIEFWLQIKTEEYSKALDDVMLPWICGNYGTHEFMLVQDSALKHGAKEVLIYLKDKLHMFENYYFSISKNKTNYKHTAHSKIAWAPSYCLRKCLLSFACWYLCCRYIRQPTIHKQQNAYNYYVKLHIGLIRLYSALLFNI